MLLCLACDAPVAPTATPSTPAAATHISIRWPQDRELVYRLEWSVDQRANLPGVEAAAPAVHSTAVLNGELGMQRVEVDGQALVRMRLRRVDLGAITLGDGARNVAADTTTFHGASALLEVEPGGKVTGMRVDPGMAPLVQQALLLVAADLEVVTPAGQVAVGHTWKAAGTSAAGKTLVEYRLDASDPVRVSRRKTGYDQVGGGTTAVESTGNVEVASDGALQRLEGRDVMSASGQRASTRLESRILLVRTGEDATPVQAPPTGTLTHVSMDRGALADSREREINDRIGSMTAEQAVMDLRGVGPDGRAPVQDHSRWMWQVTGLILKDDETTASLEKSFLDPLATEEGRTLTLDLLASGGTPAAQASLRRLVSSPVAARSAMRGLWFQRLSLVFHPDDATRAFVKSEYDRVAKRPVDDVAPVAITLGAVAGHSRQNGHAAAFVDGTVQLLLARLGAARTATERDAFLQAVGNTKDERMLPPVLALEKDHDPGVRSMVARNLHPFTRQARVVDTLLRLVTDTRAQVAADALGSLAETALTPPQAALLRTTVESGRIQEEALGSLLNVASGWVDNAEVPAIARHVHTHARDARTRARAKTLLDRLAQH